MVLKCLQGAILYAIKKRKPHTTVYMCLNLHKNWKTEGFFLIQIRKTGLILDKYRLINQ